MTDEKEKATQEAAKRALEQRKAAKAAERPEHGERIRGYEQRSTGKSNKTAKNK